MVDYELSQTYVGCVFAIQPGVYMIGTLIVPYVVPKWVEVRVTLMTSAFCLGFFFLLAGPVFVEKNLFVMCLGLFISGNFLAPLIIPNMTEMMYVTNKNWPSCDFKLANSKLSGILNCCYGAGGAIGPLMGASLYEQFGFHVQCDVTAISVMSFALVYFLTCQG